MADETIDVKGLTCPAPLVETKKKLKKMEVGKTLEVIGDHGPSKKEVPEMIGEQGHEIISVTEENGVWHVTIKKKK
ncbi:MAG: sulfurtransferase TusA family protein [Thermoplasmata archaeon]|nr:MAG: sulfurtransferase TusA family protein [Thermoplasmata archaeon]